MSDYDYEPLYDATCFLAGRCDHAFAQDGAGFNKLDSTFGHKLAETPMDRWSLKMANAAYKMIAKYRRQLDEAGLEFDCIPKPPDPSTVNTSIISRHINLSNNKLIISWDKKDPDFKELLVKVRAFPDRRFDPSTASWSVGINPTSAKMVSEFAREYDFIIGDNVEFAISQLIQEIKTNIQASRAVDADIEIKGINGELKPFQKAGVAYLLKAKRAILGDEMGVGKSVQSLAAVQTADLFPALIVCPASLKLNWGNEINKWMSNRTFEVLNGKPGNYNSDFTIVNYENLGKHMEAFKAKHFRAIICDEAHAVKNYKAKRTRAVKELTKDTEYVFLLTGTPVLNRPSEFASPLEILGRLGDLGGIYSFFYKYCGAYQDRFGMKFGRPRNLEELNDKLRAMCMIRRTKEDVLKELPPKVRSTVILPITNRSEYNSAATNIKAYLQIQDKLKEEDRESQVVQLAKIETLRQLAVKGKMEAVIEWITDFLESDEKLIVFAHHIAVQEAIQAAFPGSVAIKGGAVEENQRAVDKFQNDPGTKLIVCSIVAGGVGHTLTAASNVAFVELPWRPADVWQAEDRAHRIGQNSKTVNVWSLLADNTIDQDMAALINAKAEVVKAATEGRRVEDEDIFAELLKKLKG